MKIRRFVPILIAVAALLSGATPARAATTTTVPAATDARSFATSAGGWTSAVTFGNTCVGILCPTGTADYVASGGTGGASDGYLRTQVTSGITVANDTRVTWSSPSFVAPKVDSATLSVAVRSSLMALYSLRGDAELSMIITDVATPASSTVVSTTTLANSTSFSTVSADVPAGTFTAGRTYRIDLRVRITAGVATIIQNGTVGLDDVSLKLTTLQNPTNLSGTVSTSNGVTVSGSVNTNGLPTAVVVQYGATSSYGTNSNSVVLRSGGVESYTIPLSGLTVGQTYHFRAYAINADGTLGTADGTFVAPATPMNAPPTVNGSGSSQIRTVVYDRVPGTTGVTIEVLDAQGAVVGTFPDGDLDGTRAITLPDADGFYGVRIVRDSAGGHSTSATIAVGLDRTPPATTNLNFKVLPVVSKDVVRTATFNVPEDVVSAEAQVLDANGNAVGGLQQATGGRASVQLGSSDGTYRVRLTIRDAFGNTASVLSDALTLDQTAPTAGGAPTVTGALNQRARSVHFTRDGSAVTAAVEVVDGNGDIVATATASSGGDASITLPDLDGTYYVRARQTDVVGNASLTAPTATTLDRTPPTAGIAPTVAGAMNDRNRTVSFTRNPGVVTATIEILKSGALVDSVPVPSGATAPITLPNADDTYAVRVRVADVAGNEALTPTTQVVLDRTAPSHGAAPVVNGALNSYARLVRFVRDGNTATATVKVKNAAGTVVVTQVVPGTDNQVQVTLPSVDGVYRVTVTQDDGAGTVVTSPEREIELDTTPPNAGPAPTVAGAMNTRARTVSFTRAIDAGYAAVEILDQAGNTLGSTLAVGPSAAITLPDVDGDYRVRVRQLDAAGNGAVTATTTVVLDRQPPQAGGAPTVTGPRNVRARHVVFTRAADAAFARIELFEEDGDWAANFDVANGDEATITLPDMDSDYEVHVRQTDLAGNSATSANTRVTLLRGTGTDGDGNDTSGTGGDESDDDSTTGTGTDGGGGTGTGTGGGDAGPTSVSEPKATDPGAFGSLLTDCYGGNLALTDVRPTGKTVSISGLTAFAPGTPITIRDAKNRVVATATAGATGRFATTAALPAASARKSTRYTAVAGSTSSKAMKLSRATVIDAVSVTGTFAQLDGTLTGVKKGKKVKVKVRGGRGAGACRGGGKALKLDGRLKLNKRTGAFTLAVKLPSGSAPIALRVVVSGGLKSASTFVVR
ncbi:beta strand repeat-containing protein [Solirubrobacter phytolaccae]|uniref:beta strand repeat-containing protein n=1 Tax=Solirubrobacter phytolaccae TaxID=1404360 RepID=UPI0022CE0EB7|nr:Ig-like domain repeat protein [Solirubrobacter phytolaccae]